MLLGEFNQATATAVNAFQADQLSALYALEGVPSGERPDVLGADPLSQQITDLLKGPLKNGSTGLDILVTDEMVAGLASSVLKDIRINTATKNIVVGTLNLTAAQRNFLYSSIEEGLATMENVSKTILYLE